MRQVLSALNVATAAPPPYDPGVPFRRRPLVAALLATVALAGCGSDGVRILGGRGSDKPHATDAAFARAMVAHARTTGSVAQLGTGRALREELRALAKSALKRNDQELPRLV